MPSLMVPLSEEESDLLRDRAIDELRHPRDTARLLIRQALGLPPRELRSHCKDDSHTSARTSREVERVPA